MKGAIAGAVIAGVPAALQAANANVRLFIYDGRFAEARASAQLWQARGIQTLDSQRVDLGQAWREIIPPHLIQAGKVAGLTLWVDSYICQSFGRDHGMKLDRVTRQSNSELFEWTLT